MYAYIILPYVKTKNTQRNQSKEGFSLGALMTSAKNLNFTGKDGVFSQISKGVGQLNDINSKFSVIAMTQLMKNGQISNEEALNYFCTGFANQLQMTAVSMGYQTVDACVSALKNGSINGTQFLSNIGKYTSFLSREDEISNINREQVIIIDSVLSEQVGERQIETAERRVENGQTLTEFLHNMPETFSLNCAFYEGENYTWADFKGYIDYLIEKKIEITLQLGDDAYDHLVLTQFTPTRDMATTARTYDLNFKRISVGSVGTTVIENEYLKKAEQATTIVENPIDKVRQEITEKPYTSELYKLVVQEEQLNQLSKEIENQVESE